MRERHRPGLGAATLRVEPRGRPPDLDQHLLGDLLRLARISDHPQHQAGEVVIDPFEGGTIAPGHTAQQLAQVGLSSTLMPVLAADTPSAVPGPGTCLTHFHTPHSF
jgi:hypothetical protein